MKHLGDITKINGAEIVPVDVITGGSPCQDLSVAGKRAGLAGERSGLFMEQIRVIKEMRQHDIDNGIDAEHARPRFGVWENVPGALSSNDGRDFQAVLTEFIRVVCKDAPDVPLPPKGKWPKSDAYFGVGDGGYPFSVAYRIHDAQFWGVPQRRRRISLVADFGGLAAPEILFERESVSGDPQPCGAPGQEAAGGAGEGAPGAGATGTSGLNNQSVFCLQGNGIDRADTAGCNGAGWREGESYTLNTIDRPAVAYSFDSLASNSMKSKNPVSGCRAVEVAKTLDTTSPDPSKNQGGIAVVEPIVLESNQNHATITQTGVSPSLPAAAGMGGGYVPTVTQGVDVYNGAVTGEVAASLTAAVGDTNTSGPKVMSAGFSMGQSANARSIGYQEECAPTIRGGEGGNQKPHVVTAFAQNQRDEVRDLNDLAGSLAAEPGMKQQTYVYDARGNGDGDTVSTLTGDHQNRVTDYTTVCVDGERTYQDTAGALLASGYDKLGTQEAANDMYVTDSKAYSATVGSFMIGSEEQTATLTAGDYKDPPITAKVDSVVRRLTPLECERLQGFPDGWTDLGEWTDANGKRHKDADSPRYKALGNSIALPFWHWMFGNMKPFLPENPTLGSLFDGIGGFPLTAMWNGIRPVWASEIEEFPMAVTKARFGEE